jgi:hypothetical protein
MHTRRRFGLVVLGAAALALVLAGERAEAAMITWSSAQNISGDTDVVTTGILVGAFNLGDTGVTSTTVNGVPFAALAVPTESSSPFTSGNIRLATASGLFGSSNNLGSSSAPFSNLSTAYQQLLSSATFGFASPETLTLTISGLTIGQQYEFEWWANESLAGVGAFRTTATAGNSVTLALNQTGLAGGVGQFATGTFTADATSEVITFTGAPGNLPLLNGFELRNVGPTVTAVPAPASLTLLGIGAAGLLGYAWRKRNSAPPLPGLRGQVS